MQDFLTTHKKLRFLGLMHMDDCGLAMFTVPTHPLYNPDLVVSIIYVFINDSSFFNYQLILSTYFV